MNHNVKLALLALGAVGVNWGGPKLTKFVGEEVARQEDWLHFTTMFVVGGTASIASYLLTQELRRRFDFWK